MRFRYWALLVLACLAIAAGGILAKNKASAPSTPQASTASANSSPTVHSFDKRAYSTSESSSIWVIVNKQHPLTPHDYVPAHLVVPNIQLRSNITGDERQVSSVMAPSLEAMAQAAKRAGLTLTLESGYRSYTMQVGLYNSYVRQSGQAAADRFSARPGYSEHQTGLAADIGGATEPSCNVQACYADTPEGHWLAAHAYEYGFIIRYPAPKEAITGYESEPWHVRFVGVPLASEMHKEDVSTLEEFFGVSGGTTYAP